MIRPIKPRKIFFNPKVVYFKPRAIPLRELEETEIRKDELEALRLCDYLNLDQIEASRKMGISQATINRLLTSARKKIVTALIEGKAIKIVKEDY